MTEYWKSNARHWCAVCRVWMDAKAASIRTHQQGKGHREKSEEQLKERRKGREEQLKADAQLQRQLHDIDTVRYNNKTRTLTSTPILLPSTPSPHLHPPCSPLSPPLLQAALARHQLDGAIGGGRGAGGRTAEGRLPLPSPAPPAPLPVHPPPRRPLPSSSTPSLAPFPLLPSLAPPPPSVGAVRGGPEGNVPPMATSSSSPAIPASTGDAEKKSREQEGEEEKDEMGLGQWTTVEEDSGETLKREGPPTGGDGDNGGGEGKRAKRDGQWWASRGASEERIGEAMQREEDEHPEQPPPPSMERGATTPSRPPSASSYAAALFNAHPLTPPVHSASSTEAASASKAAPVQFRKRKAKDDGQ